MQLDENLIDPQLLPFLRDMSALPERDISLVDIRRRWELSPPIEHRSDVQSADRMVLSAFPGSMSAAGTSPTCGGH